MDQGILGDVRLCPHADVIGGCEEQHNDVARPTWTGHQQPACHRGRGRSQPDGGLQGRLIEGTDARCFVWASLFCFNGRRHHRSPPSRPPQIRSFGLGQAAFSTRELIEANKNNEVIIEKKEDIVKENKVITPKEKKTIAFHEAGHAIVGRLMPEHDPVHKVSIIPRGGALGVTVSLPNEDRLSISKKRANNEIAMMLGGRLAEEIVFK